MYTFIFSKISEIHEKRIDSTFSTNFYEQPIKQDDYTTIDYIEEPEAEEYNTTPEEQISPIVAYDTIEQTPYVKSQGAYYRGRLGLPSPVFNVHTRKIHPGPRFRNEMMRPKHFTGELLLAMYSKSYFLSESSLIFSQIV